jgi:hypothetical protein
MTTPANPVVETIFQGITKETKSNENQEVVVCYRNFAIAWRVSWHSGTARPTARQSFLFNWRV